MISTLGKSAGDDVRCCLVSVAIINSEEPRQF